MKKKIFHFIFIICISICIEGCNDNQKFNNEENNPNIENDNKVDNGILDEETDVGGNTDISDDENEEQTTNKDESSVIPDKTEDKVTTNKNDSVTKPNKTEDKVTTDKNDNVTTDKTEDDVTTDKNDNVTTDKTEDNVTTDKNDNVTTDKTEDNVTTDKNDNVTTNKTEDNVTTDKNDSVTTDKTEDNVTTDKDDSSSSEEPELTEEQISAKKIVDKIIKSSMSDFSKALAIHDWLTFNVDYDRTYSSYSVASTLSKRVAVCEGYARTFKMMAELAGLEVEMITGTANGQSHAWNQVKINGTWYNVDVTWDDPTSSDKKASDHTHNNYNYFLISDSTLKKDHVPSSAPHKCSTDYNRITVYKSGINNGYRSNHGFATNQEEANAIVKKMAEAGYSEFYIWYYNSSVTSANMWDEFKNLTNNSLYPVTSTLATPPSNSITKYQVKLQVPYKEWKNIPVIHNNSEFVNICNEKVGSEQFMIRYESSDGTYNLDGLSYAISYYVIEYGNSYRLYTIIPQS